MHLCVVDANDAVSLLMERNFCHRHLLICLLCATDNVHIVGNDSPPRRLTDNHAVSLCEKVSICISAAERFEGLR